MHPSSVSASFRQGMTNDTSTASLSRESAAGDGPAEKEVFGSVDIAKV